MIPPSRSVDTRLQVHALPAFSDNYLWLIDDGVDAAVVDPGDAAVVQQALRARRLTLRAILITHHHPDHIGGVKTLREATGARVYGPAAEQARMPPLDEALDGGAHVELETPTLHLDVLAVPGHTLGHIAYHAAGHGWLFCGDTLFSAGCGRLFEGTPAQMYDSLSRLAALPDDTAVYCAHEYTASNLAFAAAVEPDNTDVADAVRDTARHRAEGRPTVPSVLSKERRINPFLRTAEVAVRAAVADRATGSDDVAVLAALRHWKDGFRPPSQ